MVSGCASDYANGSAADANEAVYRLAIFDPGGDIDPLTAADPYALAITGLVTEPLVSLDVDGHLNPRLATDWSAAQDGLTWTFTLRDDAVFNDGSAVTAADVAATFDAITADDSMSPGGSAFAGILESTSALASETVQFALERPFADFPLLLTGTNTGILPAGYVPGTWRDNPVGAGQFLLEDYTIGQGATYVKNPDYWNADEINLDGVELKIYGDTQASVLAFQAGELDRIGLTSDVASTVDLDEYNIISSGYNRIDGLFFNTDLAPFDDESVRQAIAWAIDREKLVDDVYEGNAEVANDTVFLPDYLLQPQGLEQRQQDLDEVARLLGNRTIEFTLTTSYQLLGEVLQQQLNAVPGFEVTLEVLTSEQYYAEGENSPWLNAPVTATSWAKRVPSQYISLIYAEQSPMNASHYANSDLEDLSVLFDATTDEAERQLLADDIAEIQWTDVPVVVPAFSTSRALQNTRVVGDFVGALDFYSGYNFAGISIAN
ncbi:ABC transporter substrate-binding protein [Microbacterium marmarense]|uniref:ABC transporter substrate-binding protein n=1 Tax=Microbacterium marmarense TaxID=3122051 RepID=A0ABU8LSI4_9MICO